MKPHWAVLWAAFFNFIAFLFFGLHVANTIGTGIIDPTIVTPEMICIALTGAIVWNILTWYFGLPSSSSHALIGGLLGAGIAKAGWGSVKILGLSKILLAIVISPLFGFCFGILLMFLTVCCFFKYTPKRIQTIFSHLQICSSALISLGHGGNDAQKTMGVIGILLFSSGTLGDHFEIPLWVVISCNFVIACGTLCGGWRIVRTMGMKITKLKPVNGFCAETGSAMMLFLANFLGVPISTTHTITGAIIGVGSLQTTSAVRWGVAKTIVWAWLFTIPASATVSALLWLICF
jgi:PiT family inorganic phosphate transporter